MRSSRDTRPRTVVMLQYTGIGDLIWHIHCFKVIAEHSQNGQVTVVAQPSTLTRAFIGTEPWVEAVIDHDHRPRREEKRRGRHAGLSGMRRMAEQLKSGQFDRIILFSGRCSRGLIAWLSDIPVRLGFGYKPLQRVFLSQGPYIDAYKGNSVAAHHEASAFMVAHGFCTAPIIPRLMPPADLVQQMTLRLNHLPRPLCAFAIGTSERHKQWGAQNFAALACKLISDGCGVLLLGGSAEVTLAQKIESLIPKALHHAVTTITDAHVLGSAAALQVADFCVGNDTGMTNVAAAVGRPSFVLIGSRPTLAHDPVNLHNVTAAKLSDITVEHMFDLLQKVRHGVTK